MGEKGRGGRWLALMARCPELFLFKWGEASERRVRRLQEQGGTTVGLNFLEAGRWLQRRLETVELFFSEMEISWQKMSLRGCSMGRDCIQDEMKARTLCLER